MGINPEVKRVAKLKLARDLMNLSAYNYRNIRAWLAKANKDPETYNRGYCLYQCRVEKQRLRHCCSVVKGLLTTKYREQRG